MSTCANCKELVAEEWSANNGLCDPCEMDRAVMTTSKNQNNPQPVDEGKKLKVLIACEYSGKVREAFRKLGHDAWSCDLLPSDDNSPYHIQRDALEILNDGWDMMIAHPPCTYLTNAGVSWLYRKEGRWEQMREGAVFFKKLLEADIPKIAVENPIMHKYAVEIIGRRQDQVIQPYMFGHLEQKGTCLWLKGLPTLQPTTDLKAQTEALPNKERQRLHWASPGPDRWKIRSETYQGIADAMASQWGLL